jgi:ABC-type lipoprotein release transport system permease subunit
MYKLIIKSAFASLFRRPLRTILVIIMISVSLWGLLFMQGYYDGTVLQMINNAIRSDSGEVSIFAKEFRSTREIKHQIKDEKNIEELVKNDSNVKSYVSRVVSDGLVATARYSKNTIIYGVDREKEINQGKLDKYIKKGEFSFGTRAKGAIIGYKLAKKLKVDIGKKIIISSQDTKNEVTSISLRIKGIIKTNNMALDESAIFIDKQKAKKFLALSGVSQISIMLKDYSKVKAFKEKFKNRFKNIEVYDWAELYPALLQTKNMMSTFSYISYFIVFLTAAIGIFGVVLVSVLERLREFGILRAVGTKFKIIASMIFFESFFIGFIGFFLGSLFGGVSLYYFSIYGFDLTSIESALDEFGMDAITYTVVDINYFVTAFLAVFSATFLSVLIPLRVLKKSKPIEVING